MLVRGITVFTVRVEDVFIVGLLTRLAVLATWCQTVMGKEINGQTHDEREQTNSKGGDRSYVNTTHRESEGVCAHPYQGATGGEDSFDRSAASSTAATTGGIDPLFFLPAIAEPDPNHLLLHVELVSDHCDLFRGRFLVLLEEGKRARYAL